MGVADAGIVRFYEMFQERRIWESVDDGIHRNGILNIG